MKKTVEIIILIIIPILFSCTSINVKKDKVSDITYISMKMNLIPDDYKLIQYIESEFVREFDGQKKKNAAIKFNIKTNKVLQMFNETVKFKIDGKIYNVTMKSEASNLLKSLTGDEGLSYLGNIGLKSKPDIDLAPTIVIPTNVENAILNAKTIIFSVYSGSNFAVFDLSEKKIESIKKFLTFFPE